VLYERCLWNLASERLYVEHQRQTFFEAAGIPHGRNFRSSLRPVKVLTLSERQYTYVVKGCQ